MEEQKKKKSKLPVVLYIVGGVYLIGVLIFSFITLPNTKVNGRDVSYSAKSSVLANSWGDFDIDVKGRDDKSLSFNTEEIDYKKEVPKDASLDQNPFSWPKAYIRPDSEGYNFSFKSLYDEDKLDQIIEASPLFQNVTAPQNAKIIKKEGDYEIKKEVEGNQVDPQKLKDKIIGAIETGEKEVELTDEDYHGPDIRSDDEALTKKLQNIKEISALSYKLDIEGFDIKLEGDDFLDLFNEDEESNFTLDYDKTTDYFTKVAERVNTYGKTRTFNTTGMGKIEVGPGVYGRKLDIPGTVDALYSMVDAKKSGDLEPVWAYKGFVRTKDGGDIGDTYIEIDLSRQHLWFYKNGEVIVSTDVVTGRNGYATNVGVGSILSKENNATLKGDDFDGSKYETPVKYRMPIGRDGEGLHDSPWRGGYGGSIYMGGGSHGCINTPPDQVARIFENVDFGTPVVVYESSTSFSPAMAY